MPNITIRPAVPEDTGLILTFIRALAEYEHMADQVCATEELLADWIFAKNKAKVNLAFCDGVPAGFTLYCFNFSTFLGRAGIWLEDLFVLPEYRGQGIGLSLMRTLAREAVEGGFGRFEWSCLDWNTPSIEFYKRLGAVAMDEWTTYRLTGEALVKLAEGK
ncbi:MAG: GNAT family N-acetyltransferase [Clostridia bacterium]|nr:GNAT family N-acetyltransferase [Clostridia bacterium]